MGLLLYFKEGNNLIIISLKLLKYSLMKIDLILDKNNYI